MGPGRGEPQAVAAEESPRETATGVGLTVGPALADVPRGGGRTDRATGREVRHVPAAGGPVPPVVRQWSVK
ncbi:hypothetical protein OG909_28680 [Streptomyces sp. NBC_01754]|uniref:hypothetical protein n=1 Tax=Streptomyces sp. NBC_01754 TaxID=2975930 RepID=UPI002DD8EB96|nr:hypothetical protein [Streptomyces sp. NBC_01754]WSC95942.1 hypothetical protein OG909_28680 [Streptomyces sp. NBC_01754]